MFLIAVLVGSTPVAASAAEISTHVLDLARGVGGRDVPVALSRRSSEGQWSEVAKSRTDENGRVKSFIDRNKLPAGLYKLQFDLSGYPDTQAKRFFPEVDLVFRVDDADAHYHVPIVVSPFGYSTYRGN